MDSLVVSHNITCTHLSDPHSCWTQRWNCRTTCEPQSSCSESAFQFCRSRLSRLIRGFRQPRGSSPDSSCLPSSWQWAWDRPLHRHTHIHQCHRYHCWFALLSVDWLPTCHGVGFLSFSGGYVCKSFVFAVWNNISVLIIHSSSFIRVLHAFGIELSSDDGRHFISVCKELDAST